MTDKEFKRLSRAQLIDIIYQLQVKQDALTAENEKLSKALEDKRIRFGKVGNIAEAALAVNHVMESAQAAAEQYLEEIRTMQEETQKKCQRLLENAQKEADAIVARAKKTLPSSETDLEAIMKEFGQK